MLKKPWKDHPNVRLINFHFVVVVFFGHAKTPLHSDQMSKRSNLSFLLRRLWVLITDVVTYRAEQLKIYQKTHLPRWVSTVQSDSLDQCLYFPPRPAYQQNPCLSVDALENLSRGFLVNFSRILPKSRQMIELKTMKSGSNIFKQ